MTATLAALWRHPLKSHGREELASVTLTPGQGLPWDRHWALAHHGARLNEGEWGPCANFVIGSRNPRLMAIDATLNEGTGTLTLTHPDQPALTFHPDQPGDAQRFLEWVRPLCDPDRAPARLFQVPGRGLTDTDYPSVSLINLASGRALSAHMGADLSPLRWRANLWVEGWDAYAERDLVGCQLRIGEAILKVIEPKVRCKATTANPATGVRDVDTLAGLRALFNDQNFGLYARVTQGGTIRRDDQIEILS